MAHASQLEEPHASVVKPESQRKRESNLDKVEPPLRGNPFCSRNVAFQGLGSG